MIVDGEFTVELNLSEYLIYAKGRYTEEEGGVPSDIELVNLRVWQTKKDNSVLETSKEIQKPQLEAFEQLASDFLFTQVEQ